MQYLRQTLLSSSLPPSATFPLVCLCVCVCEERWYLIPFPMCISHGPFALWVYRCGLSFALYTLAIGHFSPLSIQSKQRAFSRDYFWLSSLPPFGLLLTSLLQSFSGSHMPCFSCGPELWPLKCWSHLRGLTLFAHAGSLIYQMSWLH